MPSPTNEIKPGTDRSTISSAVPVAPSYTPALLKQFDRLTMKLSSRDQLKRIEARCDLAKFEQEHGKEVCNAMFEVLRKRAAKRSRL